MRGSIAVDARIHGRGDQQRTADGQRRDGEQAVGDTVGQFTQRVGGAWRDDHQFGGLAQPHMQYMRLSTP